MRARLRDIVFDRSGNAVISFETAENFRDEYDNLADGEVDIEIKKWRPKRSLDANAYAWVLLDKLSAKLGIPKEELYREEIRNVGGVSRIIGIETEYAEDFRRLWGSKGLGWQTEVFESKKKEGISNIICYKGSSAFDSKQMSDLIDNIIQDCEAQGIPTMTDEQIQKLIGDWKQ